MTKVELVSEALTTIALQAFTFPREYSHKGGRSLIGAVAELQAFLMDDMDESVWNSFCNLLIILNNKYKEEELNG